MKKTIACFAFLFLSLSPAQAALGSQLDIDLRATVPEVCNIGSVTAVASANITTLNVSASCNASRFAILLDSKNDLEIVTASAGLGAGQVIALDKQIITTPVRPGAFEYQISLANSIQELDGLNISIATS